MEASVKVVEAKVEEASVQEVLTLESLEQLTAIELAYVGGGTASVSFV